MLICACNFFRPSAARQAHAFSPRRHAWSPADREDIVDCPRFVAFEGASREDSSSSFNVGQLTKRIHSESNEFDEEEARQAQRKDRRRRMPFFFFFFKVENNSLELTRIFKESFKDQRWAWEESVRAEKRDRDAEREKETFRRQRHHQSFGVAIPQPRVHSAASNSWLDASHRYRPRVFVTQVFFFFFCSFGSCSVFGIFLSAYAFWSKSAKQRREYQIVRVSENIILWFL